MSRADYHRAVRTIAALSLTLGVGSIACGDVASVTPDASSDAGRPDATPPGPVELSLEDPFLVSAGLVAGAGVLVFGPDGDLVGETETDAEGAARVDDVPPGSVLVVFLPVLAPAGTADSRSIAVFDVQPGDQIAFRSAGRPEEQLPNMTVQLPVAGGAASYWVSGGCGTGSSVNEVVSALFRDSCVIEDDVDLLAWTLDEFGNALNFLTAKRPYVAGGSLDLSALTWQAYSPVELAVSDVPPEVQSYQLGADLLLGRRAFGSLLSGAAGSGEGTLVVLTPPGEFGDSYRFDLTVYPVQALFASQQVELRAEPAATTSLALGEELLPWYSSAIYGADQQELSWSRTAGRDPDAQYVVFGWLEKGTGATGTWYAVAPPGWREARLPRLPDEHAARLPSSPQAFDIQVFAAESSTLDGWDAARQRGFDLMHSTFLLGEAPGAVVHRSQSPGGPE